MGWHLVGCLRQLIDEVDDVFPNRSTATDGTIGDADHSARWSDHNPTDRGAVCAWDVTEGPAAEALREFTLDVKPAAVKYEISKRRIRSSTGNAARLPWLWGWYGGSNPHDSHTHLSTYEIESTAPWGFVDYCRANRLGRFSDKDDTMGLPYEVNGDVRRGEIEVYQYRMKNTVDPELVVDGIFGPASLAALRLVPGNEQASALTGAAAYRLEAHWAQEMARRGAAA